MTTIVLRELPDGHQQLLAAFDALAPGASVVLLGTGDPAGYLEVLQRERAGLYDWNYLAEGPEVWRVALGRRPPARERRESVGDLLGFDHDRLDAILAEARRAWEGGDLAAAQEGYGAFAVGLARHIRAEEELLFPAFEAVSGMPPNTGPTMVMRMEHRDLERALAAIREALEAGAPSEPPEMRDLLRLLESHNRKEEYVLYPATDGRLAAEERIALCRRIESLPRR